MTPIPLPVLGIDMLSDETQMPAGTVRAAVNVDIDRAGQPRRRQGRSLAISGADIGSLRKWGGALIAVSGTQVVSIDPATLPWPSVRSSGTSRHWWSTHRMPWAKTPSTCPPRC